MWHILLFVCNASFPHFWDVSWQLALLPAVGCCHSLNAGCNKISSTSALEALPALKVLALHSNAIDKPSAVLLLSKLTSLQHLTLAHNPVCKQQDWQKATVGMLPGLQVIRTP